MSKGKDIKTKHNVAPNPLRGIVRAIAIPKGISISKTMEVKTIWRVIDA
jgi:hypothetical protein